MNDKEFDTVLNALYVFIILSIIIVWAFYYFFA